MPPSKAADPPARPIGAVPTLGLMRIIAGEFRSRKLIPPPDKSPTRPIPDRVKESIFNLMRGHFEGIAVLDAFAGTGSIGLEALSRGASFCTFIERDRNVAKVLEANIKLLRCEDRAEIVFGDALAPSSLARIHERVHLAFYDPPYAVVENALGWRKTKDQLVRTLPLLDEGGFLFCRTPWPFTHIDENEGRDLKPREPEEMPPAEMSIDLADPNADALLDAFEEQLGAIMQGPDRSDVDLSLPGAVGPETHVYGSTAMHLYQAAR